MLAFLVVFLSACSFVSSFEIELKNVTYDARRQLFRSEWEWEPTIHFTRFPSYACEGEDCCASHVKLHEDETTECLTMIFENGHVFSIDKVYHTRLEELRAPNSNVSRLESISYHILDTLRVFPVTFLLEPQNSSHLVGAKFQFMHQGESNSTYLGLNLPNLSLMANQEQVKR